MDRIQRLYGYTYSALIINAISFVLDSVIPNSRFFSFTVITLLFLLSFEVNPSGNQRTFPFAFQLKYRGLPRLK